jgi:hypothetical protein
MTRIALLWTQVGTEAAERWRVRPSVAYVTFALPIVGGLLVALSRASKPLFKGITGEDRLLEYAQFGLYLATAILAMLVAHALWRSHHPLAGLAYLGLAVGAIFVAGEEIAWGQRIFDFETPESLERINDQLETTTHNIGPVQNAFNGVVFVASLYGCSAPWFLSRGVRPRWSQQRLFVPPLFLTGLFAIEVAYRLVRWIFFPGGFTATEYGEWPEFCFALALGMFVLLNLRLLRAPVGAPAPASASVKHRNVGNEAGPETVRLAEPDN